MGDRDYVYIRKASLCKFRNYAFYGLQQDFPVQFEIVRGLFGSHVNNSSSRTETLDSNTNPGEAEVAIGTASELERSEEHQISPGLQRIVHRCLEKDPRQPFQSAKDLNFALENNRAGSDLYLAALCLAAQALPFPPYKHLLNGGSEPLDLAWSRSGPAKPLGCGSLFALGSPVRDQGEGRRSLSQCRYEQKPLAIG